MRCEMEKKRQQSGKRNLISLALTVVVLFAGSFVGVRPVSAQGSLTDQALVILDAAEATTMQQAIPYELLTETQVPDAKLEALGGIEAQNVPGGLRSIASPVRACHPP